MKPLFTLFTILLLKSQLLTANAQRTDQPWQLDVAAGMHSFYAPIKDLKWRRPELVTTAGWGKLLGRQQAFAVTLQFGYARNNYHGDALFVQALAQFTPVIAQKIEAGIGLGFGYRVSFYPSTALQLQDGEWKKGKSFKGMYQVPAQLSMGYRSLHALDYNIRPYVAYQLQALLGYSPDLSPLPSSAALLGIKVSKP
jgi:hypothetical protein